MKFIINTTAILSVGEVVTVSKYGTTGIHVKKEGAVIGAAIDTTVEGVSFSPGYVVYTYLKGDEQKATVLEHVQVAGENSLYLAELLEEEKPTAIEFALSGTYTVYPGKEAAKTVLDEKGLVMVTLKLIDGKVVGMFNGKEVGHVRGEEKEILAEFLADLGTLAAEVTSMDKGNLLGTVRFASNAPKPTRISIADAMSRIVADGIDSQENLEEKLKYLKENKVSSIAIANLFASYRKYPSAVAARIPQRPNTLFVDTTEILQTVVPSANEGKHLAFEGEKGVGKNVLTETMAWLYNRPLYEFSFNSAQSNNTLLGGKTFADEKEDTKEDKKELVKSALSFLKMAKKSLFKGETESHEDSELEKAQRILYKALGKNDKSLVFEMSSILEAMVNGGILVVDEFNTAQPSILSVFNSLLDDRGRMEVTGLGQIVKDRSFFAISTQNKDYEGTFELNEATADRFEPVIFPAPINIIDVIQARVPGIGYDVANECNTLYMGIRAAVTDPDSDIDMQALSIRGFVSACEVTLRQGVPLNKALISHVANRIKDIDSRDAVKSMIEIQLG